MSKLYRREFLISIFVGIISLVFGRKVMTKEKKTKMPLLFIGHGSPMNAIEENDFTKTLKGLAKDLPSPKALLVISAHWGTRGSFVTGMSRPKTIHDFYGFPKKLFEVQYPVMGAPELAATISELIEDPDIHIDGKEWGIDHGTWSVLKHIYPDANIPTLQLSLDMTKPFDYHFKLGEKIKFLREKGVLIIGSGNIVHNLKKVKWGNETSPYDWAVEFDQWVTRNLVKREFEPLINKATSSISGTLSIPTTEHYLPLLYIIGASEPDDKLTFEYEGFQNGSLSMRCFKFS